VAKLTDRESLEDGEYTQLKRAFSDDIVNSLGDGFDPALTLDKAVLEVLRKEDEADKEHILEELYPRLLMELVELKEMMD
jgi:hypothetical protein